MPMALDDRTSQEQLTPEERRGMLRAFADRMLIKVTALDDPEDLPGVERAVRVAAMIERVYSRCDRSETHAPDPRKLEAERARNTQDAIKSRVHLADTLKWGEERRQHLGPWWDAAETKTEAQTRAQATAPGLTTVAQAPAVPATDLPLSPPRGERTGGELLRKRCRPGEGPAAQDASTTHTGPVVTYTDLTYAILQARADLGLKDIGEPRATGGSDPPPR